MLEATLSDVDWATLPVGIVLAAGLLTLLVGWPAIAREMRVHVKWRDEHPAMRN